METRNQLLLDSHHDQEAHSQPAFSNDLLSSVAAQENYTLRSQGVTSHGLLHQHNIGNYGIAAERTTLEQRLSPEQYTSGGYHNAVGFNYGSELSPYHDIYAGPDLRDACQQRPAFDEYYEPTGNEYIGQPAGGEHQNYHAGYTSPGPIDGSDTLSEHLTGDSPDGEIPQELSSSDEQVFDHEDEGVDEVDQGDDDENEGDDDEDEGVTNDEANDAEDSIQDNNSAPKRKHKPKDFGQIRQESDGSLSYRAKTGDDESSWVPATYLTPEVRQEMLSDMSRYGKYKFPRKSGDEDYDQTCFHPDQEDWGKEEDDRPEILYTFNKPEPPKKRKRPSPIEHMKHKGMIVIAYGSKKPIRDFSNIPMCLSTKTEAWLLEAWARQNPRIVLQDFCDRMPMRGRPKPKDLSMRRSRYRWKKGLKSWITRAATKKINAWIDLETPKKYRDANSTRGWPGLTEEKSKALHELCKGQFPERARKAKRAQLAAEGSLSESSSQANDQSQNGKNNDNSVQSTGSSQHTQTADAPIVGNSQQTTTPARARPKKTPKSRKSSGVNESTMSMSATNSEGSHSDENLSIGAGQHQPHPVDYRDQDPSTGAVKRAIQRALAPTRHHIQELLGIPTRPTDKNASYNQQWMALYQWYRSMAIASGFDEPLDLGQHEAWLNGFPQEIFIDTCELPETIGSQL